MLNQLFVKLDGISRVFTQGSIQVSPINRVSCRIKSGERIALEGPSGSGKSTLLHMLAGIDTPTGGEITWPALGQRSELRPMRIGLIFQSASLISSLTVLENVELPLLLGGRDPENARKKARRVLDVMELQFLSKKLPQELSGGQSQRIALARVLAVEPKLILADEPTGQLDHQTAEHLLDILFDSIKSTDTAILLATHDRTVAERMDKVWHLHDGELEEQK